NFKIAKVAKKQKTSCPIRNSISSQCFDIKIKWTRFDVYLLLLLLAFFVVLLVVIIIIVVIVVTTTTTTTTTTTSISDGYHAALSYYFGLSLDNKTSFRTQQYHWCDKSLAMTELSLNRKRIDFMMQRSERG
uniref:Uncharacterized protein n=1 Tax=Glossina palpalis gambiensis TaxID=67801 RepID=A0A1B0C7M2_9MUSC